MKSLSEKLQYGGGNKHTPVYCGRKFRVNGKVYTYDEADSVSKKGVISLVIKFSDATKQYTMSETEFFQKVKL